MAIPTNFIFKVWLYLVSFSHKTDANLMFKSESLLLRGFSWLFCYSDYTKLTHLKSDEKIMFRHQIIYNFEIENSLSLTAQNGCQ